MTAIVFPLGAMMFYAVLYQSNLIPRWLSVWGLIGVTLHLMAMGVGGIFTLTSGPLPLQDVFAFPILVQEMVMAGWLIVRGFNPSATASGSLSTDANERRLSASAYAAGQRS